MLRTHRAGKGRGGWGLGSRNRRGPGVPHTPGLRGQGTSPGSPAGFLGSSGWGKCSSLLSCSSWRAPPACLSSSPPGLPPMPSRTQSAWRGLGGRGDWSGSSAGSLCPSGWGSRPLLLSCSSGRTPPACLSWSPCSPSCAPRTHTAWMGLWREEPAWELSRLPGPSGPGDCPLLLSCSSRRVPPTCLS